MSALELNAIDVLVLVGALTIVGIAFFQGIVQQTMYLISCLLSLLVAAYYHRQLARWIGETIPASDEVLSTFAFVVIFLVSLGVYLRVATLLYSGTRLPGIGAWDNLGGALVGCVTAYVVIAITLRVIAFMTNGAWPDWNDFRTGTIIALERSRLAATMANFGAATVTALQPWFPSGVPAILSRG